MGKEIIKKITINLAGTEVEVTPKQARELHDALQELLGIKAKETIVKYEWYPHYWYTPAYSGTMTTTANPNPIPFWYSSTSGSTALYNATSNEVKLTIN